MRVSQPMAPVLALVLGAVVFTTAPAFNEPEPLIADPDFGEWDPAWSTDGTKIAFDSDRSGNLDVWIYDYENGGEPVQLTTDLGGDGWACWSPDDETIVFMSDRNGSWDLYTIPSTGGTAVPLVDGPNQDVDPNWSPDGNWITYCSNTPPFQSNLWKVPATGGTPIQLTDTNLAERNPYYSPDGTEILFRYGNFPNTSVQRVSSDGGEPTPLVDLPGFEGDPAWSPDGDWVLYAKYDPPITGERGPLYVYTISGGFEARLTDPPIGREDFYNDWHFDQTSQTNKVIFESTRILNPENPEDYNIWIVEFDHPIATPESFVTPDLMVVHQNVPNPFNPHTTFRVDLVTDLSDVRLVLYDTGGRRVREIPLGDRSAGGFEVGWDGRDDAARDLPSGVYLYQIEHATGSGAKGKATLLR